MVHEMPHSAEKSTNGSTQHMATSTVSYANEAYVADGVNGVASLREIDLRRDAGVVADTEKGIQRNDDAKRMSFDDALDIIGFGRMQIAVLLVCGTIIMTVLTETMGMGLIMTAAHCDMELTATRKGIISSVTFIGILLSSQIWGFLADTRGRRRVVVSTMLAANACTIASSFSVDFTMFVITRFLAGIFMSASSCVTYAYLGEFNTNKNRSSVIAAACIFAGAAYVYLPLMGYLILPNTWSLYISDSLHFRPWRLLVIVNTLPGMLAALCMIRLPESGKFLLSQGNESGALLVLQRIHEVNTGQSAATMRVRHLLPEADAPVDRPNNSTEAGGILQLFWRQTVPLFRRPLRLHFLICCFLVFGVFFVSAGIGMWYPEIQNRVSRADTSHANRTVCQVLEGAVQQRRWQAAEAASSKALTNAFEAECNDSISDSTFMDYGVLGAYYVIMYVVYALGIRRMGLGLFLVTFLFVSGLTGISLQWVTQPVAVVVLFSSHIVFSGICISMLTGIVVILIPTEYRGMAVSISMMFGRLGSIVGSNLVGVMLESNCSATFYMYSGFILVCGMTSLLLPIRTL